MAGVTLADSSQQMAGAGQWLKAHHGPATLIFLLFVFSGLLLDAQQIRQGLTDVQGTVLALILIFGLGPALAVPLAALPLEAGVKIGFFLVAVMPTTFSSGVVMTGASGGNMAHALLITVIANILCIFTIPITLPWLLALLGKSTAVAMDRGAIMLKLGLLVLLPLSIGLGIRCRLGGRINRFTPLLQISNQIVILAIVWMAVSGSREAILGGKGAIVSICLLSAFFHAVLLAGAFGFARVFAIPPGRRESLIFMGGQKTLTLSIILQVSLFPRYGLALAVCVIHHLVHLMMDGYLAGQLGKSGNRTSL